MLNSEDLRFFAVVSQEKSLSAAARRMDITASAVTQRLSAIETRLGLRLTHRNGRGIILTEEGLFLAEKGTSIIRDLDVIVNTISARRSQVSGQLRVLASLGFGQKYLAPLCASFQAKNPEVTIDLHLSDRLGRHPEQAWDIAIHIGSLPNSTLRVRKLIPNRRLAVASPEYLQLHPAPGTPADLAEHDCLVLRENDEDASLWKFFQGRKPMTVRVKPRLSSNSGEVLRDWALEGRGIMIRSEWAIAEDLSKGRLKPVLEDYPLPNADIVYLVDKSSSRNGRTRLFIGHLIAHLKLPSW